MGVPKRPQPVDEHPGIYRSPGGRYSFRYRCRGGVLTRRTSDDLPRLLEIRAEIEELRQQGVYARRSHHTLAEVADQWLAAEEARVNAGEIAANTLARLTDVVDRTLKTLIGIELVHNLDRFMILDLATGLGERDVPRSTQTLVLNTLRRILDHAQTLDLVEYNAVDRYRQTTNGAPSSSSSTARAHPLSPQQLRALFKHADPSWRVAYELVAETGLHTGELLALQASDFHGTSLHVQRRLSCGEPLAYPNGDPRRRELPLTTSTVRDLQLNDQSRDGERLFAGRNGRIRTNRAYDLAFKRACEKSRLDRTAASLRTTYVEAQLRSGMPLAELSRRLGHATIESTYRAYRQLIVLHGRSAEVATLRRGTFAAKRANPAPAALAELPLAFTGPTQLIRVRDLEKRMGVPVTKLHPHVKDKDIFTQDGERWASIPTELLTYGTGRKTTNSNPARRSEAGRVTQR